MINNIDYTFKIILLGDNCVGKTSLFQSYLYYTNFIGSNNDIEDKLIEINNKLIRINLWNTCASSFPYLSVQHFQAKCTKGVIIVYDITNRQSFDNVVLWYKEVQLYVDKKAKIILVGNKCEDDSNRNVSIEEGKKLADKFGIKFIETSAKTNYNVENAFNLLIYDIFDYYENVEKSNIKVKNDDFINQNSKCYH